MKKSPFVLKNSNVTSQSVPNKKASNTTSTLNYLQILKQYNSCKIVKNENSSLQPTSRLKNSKDASSSQNPVIIAPSNLKFKVNINTCSTKNILKPSMPINTQNDEKINSQPLIHSSKIYNKYMVKVPNDNYLRSSKSKENESDESKTIPVPNIMDKGDKENVYFIADKNFAKRNNKLSSYGSERGSLNKEKYSSPKEQQKLKISSTSKDNFDNQYCFFHPDKKAKYMKSKGDNSNSEQEQQNFYCSKCAIDLALKGVRVYDIEENSRLELKDTTIQKDSLHSYEGSPKNFIAPEEKNEYEQNKIPTARGREIEDFLNKLKAAKKNGNSSYFLLEKRKTDISNFYQQQILKTEEFFKRLEIILQTNKRILTDKLQKFREETEGLFTNLTKQTEFNITEIQKIEFDITENVENILKNMEEQPFKTIITKYESKITQYQQNFIELYKEPLILNKILISFKNYKEQESNYSKFNEEVWNLIRPYFSFNRVPVTFLEEYNDLELMTFPPKKEIFVSFENKDFFEDNQKAIYDEDEKKNLNFVNIAKKIKGNFCASSTESLSSPTSKKYMDLLSKINNNQENNNIFFSNYMGKNETIIGNCDEVGTKKKENTQIVDSFQKNLMFSPHFREKMDL